MFGTRRFYDDSPPRELFLRRGGVGNRASFAVGRVLDLLFGALYAVLCVRFLLEFFQAHAGGDFYALVTRMSDVFYNPFKGLVSNGVVDGHPIAWALVVAVLAYMLLHAGLRAVLRFATRLG